MKKVIGFLFLFFSLQGFAQDPHWSTVANHPVLQNPAFLTADSVIHGGVVYRTQWSGFTDPFRTVGLFAGIPLEEPWTIGLNIWDDRSGNVGWAQTNVRLQAAWKTTWNSIDITLAGGLGFDQRSIDTDELVFPDQINDDLSLSQTNEIIDGTISNLDNSLGARAEIPVKGQPLTVGVSLDHLLSTNQGFIGEAKIPNRWNATVSYPIPINPSFTVRPFAQWQRQRKQQHAQGGAQFLYDFMGYRLSAGAYYRLNDAVIGEVGVTNHTWKLGVAYDQSANSTLNSIGRNANAWEFYVGFRIPDKTPVIEPPVELPEPETIEPLTYQIRWKISSNDTSELDSLHFMVNDENIFEFNQPNDTFSTPWLVFSGCDSIRIRITGSGFAYYKDTIYTPCPLNHSDSVVFNVLMTPLKKNTIIRLENIYFSFDSDTLLPESKEELNELVRLLDDNPSIAIEISAHTDNVGNAPYNLDLSQRRAERCVNYLVERGIEKGRLVARGYGESKPVARNTHPDGTDNPKGRAQNRRVEFIILKGRE